MTKIRLNKTHRDIISNYGQEVIDKLIDRKSLDAAYESILSGVNTAIRKKFPEAEMIVLRKHNLSTVDRCLKMQFPTTGRVDGFNFEHKDEKRISDLPYRRGCGTSDVFAVDEATEAAYDSYHLLLKAYREERSRKLANLNSLVESAKTLDDVLEVIDLPPAVQERLGKKSQALVALSPETLTQLKDDFKLATAA
jgi:hypothetical protein